jgi:hypothetical protein
MSTHQKVQLLTRSTTSTFCVSCMMWCSESDLHCGSEVISSCTMTTPPPNHPTLSRTSWLNIRSHKCCSPPIHQTWPRVTFLFPKVKILKGKRFQDMEEIK